MMVFLPNIISNLVGCHVYIDLR